jgi:hypothetical protein
MTELPSDLWKRVLEFARAPPVSLPLYPAQWRREWVQEALAAHDALLSAGRQDLELAIAFGSQELLQHLRLQEISACRFWQYLTRYRDFMDMLFGNDDDDWSLVEFLPPPTIDREPIFVYEDAAIALS